LFDAGKLAVALQRRNAHPATSKAAYQSRSVPLPPKLFSHNDQQSFWQASNPEEPIRLGRRIGDLFQSGNGLLDPYCINASGNAVYLSGRSAVQYGVTTTGPFRSSTIRGTVRLRCGRFLPFEA
jgi:uncharacterized protein (DUF1501 family)